MDKNFYRFNQNFLTERSTANRCLSAFFWKNSAVKGLKIFIVLFCLSIFGCQSRVFDNSGQCLFSSKSQEKAKTIGNSKEGELVRNTTSSTGGKTDSPWAPTKAEEGRKEPKIDTRDAAAYYTAQRPNGAVLFPNKLDRHGPCVVLEPGTLVAPVGEEVVLVASYVGPNDEYLRTGEKLKWTLDGVGKFQTNNPGGLLNGGCADGSSVQKCKLMPGSKKEYGDLLETTTSAKLWRIHRGTPTPLDDISILRGQSWVSIQSAQEGTSAVTVLADNIDNWNNRTAIANVCWLDAYFLFPKSGTAPAGQAQQLTTSVVRKSNPSEPRSGWLVRYEVISGPDAGFGPNFAKEIEVATNADGQANAVLTQRVPSNGTNQVLVKIIKPAADISDRVIAAEKQITQAWTGGSFFSLQILGASSVKRNVPAAYKIQVTNLTSAPLSAILVLPIGPNVSLVNSVPNAFIERGSAVWNLDNIPARKAIEVSFSLLSKDGGVIDLVPRIRRKDRGSALSADSGSNPGVRPPAASVVPSISGSTSNPAALPPSLPNNPASVPGTGIGGKLKFNIKKPAPATVRINEEFSFVLVLTNPENIKLQNVLIDTYVPDGSAYVSDGKRFTDRVVSFGNLPFSSVANKTLPFIYVGTTPGEKNISVKVTDPATKALLAEFNTKVVVSGQKSPENQPKRSVSVDIIPRDSSAPNFTIGSIVSFLIRVKNNESYTLSKLKLFCIPEEDRSLRPWNFVQSEPVGAVKNPASESWTYNLPDIPAGGESGLSISFSPQKTIQNGKFIVEIQSPDIEKPVGAKVYRYSIIQKVNRPTGSDEFPQKSSSDPDKTENNADTIDRGQGKLEEKFEKSSSSADGEFSKETGSEKIIPLSEKDQKSGSKSSPDGKTTKTSTALKYQNISIRPFSVNGTAEPIVNLNKDGKKFSVYNSKGQTVVGQNFIYKIVLTNKESDSVPSETIDLLIEYDRDKLISDQKNIVAPDFKSEDDVKKNLLLKQIKEIKAGEAVNIDLAFRSIKAGETMLNISLMTSSDGKVCGIYKLPLIVNSDK